MSDPQPADRHLLTAHHNHLDFIPLTYSRLTRTPFLTTIHGFSSEQIKAIYYKYWDNAYVSISDADRDPRLRYLATVYNGIDLSQFTFRARPEGQYLLYLGRFHPEKGVHLAIQVARKAGLPLIISSIHQDRDYWRSDQASSIGEALLRAGRLLSRPAPESS